MLRPELGEPAHEGRVRDAGRERLALEAVARLEQARSLGSRLTRTPARRREPGEGLLREIEPVREETQRLLALGRVLGLREHLARADEPLLPVGRALDLEPHAVERGSSPRPPAGPRSRRERRPDPGRAEA